MFPNRRTKEVTKTRSFQVFSIPVLADTVDGYTVVKACTVKATVKGPYI